mgnify:CR=1 FL=1
MIKYYLFIIIIFFIGEIAQNHNRKYHSIYNATNRKNNYSYKNVYGLAYGFLMLSFVFMSGFRYYVGTDYGAYYKAVYTWENVKESFINFDEPIIKLITYLVRNIVNDGLAVIFVLALLTVGLCFYGISKYDEGHLSDTLLLYIFLGVFGFSFNGVRQALAVAFIFAFSGKKNSTLKNVIIILFAFLIHKSALFVLPILIIARRKIDTKQVIIIIVSAFVVPFFFDRFYSFMGVSSLNLEAMEYATHAINPIRVIVSFAPLVLLLLLKNKRIFLDKYNFLVNMVFINAMLTVTTANSALLNRMVQYTCIYISLYIPKYKQYMKTRNDELLFMGIILILYFAFWKYELGSDFIFQFGFGHWGEY